MTLLLLALGCHTLEKLGAADDSAGPSTAACDGEIYIPRSAYDSDAPVLADAHADTFGSTRPDPFQVHLSWAFEPSTSMSIVWRTDGETFATMAQFGVDASYGGEAEGRSFQLTADPEFGRIHELHLCGLTPGTTYHYRVGGEGHWSADYTFTTAPAPGTAQAFRFAVAGDSRDNQALWGQGLDAIEALGVDFYMFTGDAVDLGSNTREWDAWFEAGAGHLEYRPILMAHGNHEFNVQPYYALMAQPGNEQWFSFDYANAHFVVLNDTIATQGDLEVQRDWMQADLAATTVPWRFAFHHIPAYSSCTTHGSDLTLQELWSPVEEAGGVAIDFTGHNHNYERSHPLRDGAQVWAADGTTYVVAAGAGADLYNNDLSNAFTAVANVTNHFVLIDVDGGDLELTAYDLAGNVIDSTTMAR